MTRILETTLAAIRPCRLDPEGAFRARIAALEAAAGPLGRLGALAAQALSILGLPEGFAGLARRLPWRKAVFVALADHGVAVERVGAPSPASDPGWVRGLLAGGGAAGVLARRAGARLVVVDCGLRASPGPLEGLRSAPVARGTRDLAEGPAMSREEALRALETGIEAATEDLALAAEEPDWIGVAGLGAGAETSASALAAALTDRSVREVTGPVPGVPGAPGGLGGLVADEDLLARRVAAIERAFATHGPASEDPIEILAELGGFEIGAMAGVVLAGAAASRGIVLDGFPAAAAAALAVSLAPDARRYLVAANRTPEAGHRALLEKLQLVPCLDLGALPGDGSGAVLAMELLDGACRLLAEMRPPEEDRRGNP